MSLNTVHVAFDSTLKSFSAKISCPLCATKVSSVMTSKKLKSGHRSKAIWNISNFQLHIKVHLGPNSKKNQKLASVSDLNSNLKGFLKPKQSSVNSEVNTVRADVSNDAHSSLKCLSETPTTEKTSNSSEQVPTEVPSSDSSSEFQSQESSEVQSPASSEVQSQASILPEQNRSNMTPTLQPQTAAEELSTESQALLEKCTQFGNRVSKAVILSSKFRNRANVIVDSDSESSSDSCEFDSETKEASSSPSGEC